MERGRHVYQAVAQYGNRDAGHVCYGRTKDEARSRARERTTMAIAVRRVLVTADHYEQIAVGSASSDSLAHRI